jgi:Flp pilus assembly pilin Flp
MKSSIDKDMDMKNWILNFIADERGTAATEYGITAVVMAGGAASGLSLLRDSLQAKQNDMITILGDSDAGQE